VRDAAIDDIATRCYTFVHARLFVPAYLISFSIDSQRFMTRVHERTQCKSRIALQFFRPFFALSSSVRCTDTRVVRMVGNSDSRRRSRVRVTVRRSLRAQRNRIDCAFLLCVLLNLSPV
jgi:hypothetical protein